LFLLLQIYDVKYSWIIILYQRIYKS